jgi:hypothetical protein
MEARKCPRSKLHNIDEVHAMAAMTERSEATIVNNIGKKHARSQNVFTRVAID